MAQNSDLDKFGFEPLEVEASQEVLDLSEFGFEPIEEEKEEIEVNDTVESDSENSIIEQIQASLAGLGQGATLGFSDELEASLGTKGLSPRQEISKPISEVEETYDTQMEDYEDNLSEVRSRNKELSDKYPGTSLASEIVGGVAPSILTGGASLAANALKTPAKKALPELMKQGAKIGALEGSIAGAGYSTADDGKELAQDIATGTAAGGVIGGTLPVGIEGVKSAASGTKNTLKGITDLIPGIDDIKAGYKYGRQGKKITEEVVDKDVAEISAKILQKINKAKSTNDLISIKEELKKLGIKVDTKESIEEAIKDLEDLASFDPLKLKNKELLGDLKELTGENVKQRSLEERAIRNSIKKQIESASKLKQAVIKGEKKLAKRDITSENQLQNINDVNVSMDDLEIPFDTKKGAISGVTGKFKTKDGKEFTENVLSDTTPYQPKISKTVSNEGRPIILTEDLGSGKVNALVGEIENKVDKDLTNMSYEEVETLVEQLKNLTNIAKVSGTEKDPVLRRATGLSIKLQSLLDDAVEKYGNKDLIKRRNRLSDIYSGEEFLNIKNNLAVKGTDDKLLKEIEIAKNLAFNRDYAGRKTAERAKELLGEEVITPKDNSQLNLLKRINSLLGREQYNDNISKSGLYKKAVGDIPNIVGRKVTGTSKKLSPVTETVKKITKMPVEQTTNIVNKLKTSENPGLVSMGRSLEKALTEENTVKGPLLWSLSQNPAFREFLRRNEDQRSEEALDMLGFSPEEQEVDNNDVDITKEVENDIDRVNQQQSSGDQTPLNQIESLLEKIDSLRIPQEEKDDLENEAIQMETFSDGEALKERIRQLQNR